MITILGGYWVTVPVFRSIAQKLGIDIKDRNISFNTSIYPRYTNNWLCDHKKDLPIPNIKAAGIDWPQKDGEFGIFFMSKIVKKPYFVPLEEDDEDRKVKKWLESLNAGAIQWVSLQDDDVKVAGGGLHPQKS